MAVDDVDVARAELIERGVAVSEVFHGVAFSADGRRRLAGPDPDRKSYGSYASFSYPDGNEWLLQEVTTRLPGRVTAGSIGSLAELLHETAARHDGFEQAAPAHDWWDWYAPYLDARQHGSTSEEASTAADRYMQDVRGVARRHD